MKRFYLLFILILTVLTATGCRVFDWFSKDSSSSSGSASYTPPSVPETLEQEQPVVLGRINALSSAFETKNLDKIVELCNGNEEYRQRLSNNTQNLPEIAKALKTAKLTSLGPGYNRYGNRVGEVTVDTGSNTYTIPVVKRGGIWYFQGL
ncbi:MAG: hypothetical protein AB1403_05495 [Candidatus Riflebacteria bacterium]